MIVGTGSTLAREPPAVNPETQLTVSVGTCKGRGSMAQGAGFVLLT